MCFVCLKCINPKPNKNKQYFECVALKIIVKVSAVYCFLPSDVLQLSWKLYLLCVYEVGGRNTVLEKASMTNGIPFVSDVPTIVFGADVSHPPAGEESSVCIAAVSFLDGVAFEQPKVCNPKRNFCSASVSIQHDRWILFFIISSSVFSIPAS